MFFALAKANYDFLKSTYYGTRLYNFHTSVCFSTDKKNSEGQKVEFEVYTMFTQTIRPCSVPVAFIYYYPLKSTSHSHESYKRFAYRNFRAAMHIRMRCCTVQMWATNSFEKLLQTRQR